IAEVITHHYTQNIDLRDAKTVLSNSGTAIMGSAQASGANRATDAIMKALDSPLLNDNKITGAKNVLLLIVSGNEEITIDEIGEINDHIQAEAGHSANIIMGVGEDEALEDAIAVTIIATGFDVEQQNEITNTETKKIIHTLEDEQKAEQDLSAKSSGSVSQVGNTPMNRPSENQLQFEEPQKEEKIVHTLDENEEEVDEVGNIQKKVDDVYKTPDYARKLDVVYEEVDPEDFIINDTTEEIRGMEVNEPEEVKSESEEQFMFTFDMPANQEKEEQKNTPRAEEITRHSLEEEDQEDTRNIKVNEAIEIVPVTESSTQGIKRYSLDDYMEMEEKLERSKAPKKEEEIKDETIAIEKKTVAPTPKKEGNGDNHDPFDNPISSEVVRQRTAERKAKMKEFNYKFRTGSAQIDEIEKQPAYKRAGIELDNSKPGEGKLSRTSIDQDENNDLHFRRNNSFLHDNVD
ncbi:MAG: cell division protein FtsZ, partial [Christiangramia sp.]|nr:cell division protein FtsZ [Christiangramia sp.]